ncbi:UDP-glucose/GDP-mannose dehydrogenase family protein, partial [Mycobacterium manitobense]|nr:UDP-glucose/GDP-mannose dehydrogenase family protein [[Mycobacterium] manitobense]
SSYQEAVDFADVFFVAVATPQKKGDYGADLCFVDAVMASLAVLLDKPAVIIGKSTVPVGTAERLAARVRALAPAGEAVELAWNPEFLREGFAVQDTLHPDRLVLGIGRPGSGRAEQVVREIYSDLLGDGVPF